MRGRNTLTIGRARSLRRGATRAELLFWENVRDRRLGLFKFTRQEPIGPYYADFICRDRRLIVEIDGGQHAGNSGDRMRDGFLAENGYRVIRVWNNDVLGNLEGVLEMLLSELRMQPLTPALSPQARRGSATGR